MSRMNCTKLIKAGEFRAPPFCDCVFPRSTEVAAYKGNVHDLVSCRCGEEDSNAMDWIWDSDCGNTDCFFDGPNVTFHPIYSQGTSIIRGNKRLEPKMIHYWEIRIITSLSGTDVMFGVGTDKVNLSEYQFHFIGALGVNDQSWGYSYKGIKQHKGEQKTYGNKFTQGSIVGVYLDLSRGYLEYFHNRRSLGVAFTNIPTDPNINLYPMVCSTAAKSSIRLLNSTSQKETLQFHALRSISKQPKVLDELKKLPGLRSLLQGFWFLAPPSRYTNTSNENDLSLEDEVVLSRKSRKSKFKDEDPVTEDIYANAHKITLRERYESDDEISADGCFYLL